MFEYDVFLSYSHKDESIVHALAYRLKQDGLHVWLDEWVIKPGDLISLKIQEGLEKSHILLMCMSPAYFESEWGKMEHHTLLFRDPTNIQRRLIPLLIADCTQPDTIAQFSHIDWRTCSDEAYDKIITSCQRKNSQLFPTNLNSCVQLNNFSKERHDYKGVMIQAFYWNCPALESCEHQWWVEVKKRIPALQQAGFTAGYMAAVCQQGGLVEVHGL